MKNDYDRQILSYLNDHEMLTTEAAMEFLPLSEVSVRRIFNRLAELNLVRRVRGGVRQPVREQNIRIPYFLRGQWFAAEKQRLAKRAAELVKPDMAVAIHGGSTTSFLGTGDDVAVQIDASSGENDVGAASGRKAVRENPADGKRVHDQRSVIQIHPEK